MLLTILAPLHFGGGYPEGFWHSNWRIDVPALLAGLLLVAGYWAIIGPINRRYPGHEQRTVASAQIWSFLTGALLMTVILGPPFNDWGGRYLVSIAMAQHLVLMLVVAPLLLKGLPAWFFNPITRRPALDRIGRFLTRPVATFLIGNAILVMWHLPGFFNAALETPVVHAVQHAMLLIAALFIWWPVIAPNPSWPKASMLATSLLLFAQTLPGGIVGSNLAFADPGVYSYYDGAPRLWGISVANDQQFAGLGMWALMTVAYLSALSAIFLRWASREEAKERSTPVARMASRPDPASPG